MRTRRGPRPPLRRPAIARKLGLRSIGSLEQVTAAGVRRLPAALLDEVRAGNVIDKTVEIMIADAPVRGRVLGQTWLLRHDYLLDYRNHRQVLDGAPPAGGVRAELRSGDGRPAILAQVDSRLRNWWSIPEPSFWCSVSARRNPLTPGCSPMAIQWRPRRATRRSPSGTVKAGRCPPPE